MFRSLLLIIIVAIVIGALFFLSSQAKQQPTHSIEVPVAQGGNAH